MEGKLSVRGTPHAHEGLHGTEGGVGHGGVVVLGRGGGGQGQATTGSRGSRGSSRGSAALGFAAAAEILLMGILLPTGVIVTIA